MTDALRRAGVEVEELSGVQPNPTIGLARTGVEIAKKHGIEVVLGIGGGSVIDTVKATRPARCTKAIYGLYTGRAQPKARCRAAS